jgi:hypothetical protein
MRAARTALTLAFPAVAVACLVPSQWLATERPPAGKATKPPDVTGFPLLAAGGYFLGAAPLPRLRPDSSSFTAK